MLYALLITCSTETTSWTGHTVLASRTLALLTGRRSSSGVRAFAFEGSPQMQEALAWLGAWADYLRPYMEGYAPFFQIASVASPMAILIAALWAWRVQVGVFQWLNRKEAVGLAVLKGAMHRRLYRLWWGPCTSRSGRWPKSSWAC